MTNTATRPTRTLIRIIVFAFIALTLSAAFAQKYTAEELTIAFAMETDGVYGCTRQEIVRAGDTAEAGADCFTLEYHSETLARLTLDRVINSFYDITPLTPWQRNQNGILRMYATDDGMMFGFGVMESGYHAIIIVMVLK